jgi:hypothetical protein
MNLRSWATRAERSFDTDTDTHTHTHTQRQRAARRAGDRALGGALSLSADQLRR